MNSTNLKQIEEHKNMDLIDLMICAYDEVDDFQEWIVEYCNLELTLSEMSKDEMGDDGIWRMVFDFIEDEYDNKRSYLTELIESAWNQLSGFPEWIIKHLDLEEYINEMGPEFVEDERDADLVFELLRDMEEHPKRNPNIPTLINA